MGEFLSLLFDSLSTVRFESAHESEGDAAGIRRRFSSSADRPPTSRSLLTREKLRILSLNVLPSVLSSRLRLNFPGDLIFLTRTCRTFRLSTYLTSGAGHDVPL